MKKIKILNKQVIYFNSRSIYFLKDGVVWRGNRRTKRNRGITSVESVRNKWVVKDSIKRLSSICKGSNPQKMLQILERYGVKIKKR